MNLVAMQACLAIGSVLWGASASATGTRVALAASAVVDARAASCCNRRVRVRMGTEADVTPGVQLPELAIAVEPRARRRSGADPGRVPDRRRSNRDAFLRAIQRSSRRGAATAPRAGACSATSGEDGRFVERFIIASWAEYVRLRTRMTMADRRLQERVNELQRADVPIRVSRLIGVGPG